MSALWKKCVDVQKRLYRVDSTHLALPNLASTVGLQPIDYRTQGSTRFVAIRECAVRRLPAQHIHHHPPGSLARAATPLSAASLPSRQSR
jgi:hypothetical protein